MDPISPEHDLEGALARPGDDFVVRPATRNDAAFVASSWLRSYREAPAAVAVPSRTYFYWHHRVIEVLLGRSAVLVACDPRRPDTIVGWACAEAMEGALVLHYVYVKHSFRRAGVARALVRALQASEPGSEQVFATHATRKSFRLMRDAGIFYNPYLLLLPFVDGSEQLPSGDPAGGDTPPVTDEEAERHPRAE